MKYSLLFLSTIKIQHQLQNMNHKNATISNENYDKHNDIIISLILSESTASMLEIDAPYINDTSLYKSEISINTVASDDHIQIKNEDIDSYWFKLKKPIKSDIINGVVSDIAFFSNIESEYDSSVEKFDDLSDPKLNEDSSTTLEPVKVYTTPFLRICSIAHNDRIKSQNNNIYVSILDSQLTVTPSGWINFCRICHGGESIGDLLSPCRCRGSIALAHITCLERWLKESENSRCELCQHRYQIIRQPQYNIPVSIIMFLRYPGELCRDLIIDFISFSIYTPTALTTTYMLMLLCESIAKSNIGHTKNITAHAMAFVAIFGMAAIDFTYSSWLMVTLQKYITAWKNWYKNRCKLKVILPKCKQFRRRIRN